MGIGDFIRDRQAEGMSNEDILPLVKAKFPDARTTINSIRWYRTNPRNAQDGVSKNVQDKPHQDRSTLDPHGKVSNSRYKTYPIGNAQNGVIRNILSNLGQEAFSESHWHAAKEHFFNRCVYCDGQQELIIDHAVPINRANLGEHRIGNMLPCCKECNDKKGGSRDFLEFLRGDNKRIERILLYMRSKNYVPIGNNGQIKMILELAHKEVAAVAARYITIINSLLHDRCESG